MQELEAFEKMEQEIRETIKNGFQKSSGGTLSQKMFMEDLLEEGTPGQQIIGGLNIVYLRGSFMSVDRISESNGKFRKQRRIIYYLDSRPGQIGSTLLLQLLQFNDGDEFSKHKFVQKVDEDFFQAEQINISSGEINEALSRMFRKTMLNFFFIDGRNIIRQPFLLRIQEINSASKLTAYPDYKRDIDGSTDSMLRELNQTRR